MSTNRNSKPIHVGLVANEPIWLAGMVSVFDSAPENGLPEMVPVTGTLQELLSGPAIEYLMLDLHSSSAAVEMLGFIRRTRPDLRILVIGPEGNDELVLDSIIAGARAYLDLTAGPEMVRTAISSVTEGSIWAPRRLLSKLIDRLLNGRDTSLTNRSPHLTAREGQVLDPRHFSQGVPPASLVPKLTSLVGQMVRAFSQYRFRGVKTCSICEALGLTSPGPVWSQENLIVPGSGEVYAAPGGIVHYVEAHSYSPPERFVRAVLVCPDCDSPDYWRSLRNANSDIEPPVEAFLPLIVPPRIV